jgi:hypothetical protein
MERKLSLIGLERARYVNAFISLPPRMPACPA